MPQLQIPVELVILHLAMLAFLEKHQVKKKKKMEIKLEKRYFEFFCWAGLVVGCSSFGVNSIYWGWRGQIM